MNILAFAIWLALVLLIICLWKTTPIFPVALLWWQYVVLLRVPLIAGLFLFFFPFIAIINFPLFFGNLFVMRNTWQLISTIIGAILASLMVSFLFSLIVINAPERYEEVLGLKERNQENTNKKDTPKICPNAEKQSKQGFNKFAKLFEKLENRYYLAFLLAFPTSIVTVIRYLNEVQPKDRNLVIFLVILVSLIIPFLVHKIRIYIDKNNKVCKEENLVDKIICFFGKENLKGYFNDKNEFTRGHKSLIALAIIGLIFYATVIIANHPECNIPPWMRAPALLYLLLLIGVATNLFGITTFYADYFRFPVILIFIIISGLSYGIFGVDHYFKLNSIETPPQYSYAELANFTIPIKKRLQNQKSEEKTLVVVAASGGGIQAAGWTVEVLKGLQQELGSSFTQATGMISSASGGSVGTMFLLDQLEDLTESTSDAITKKFEQAFDNATEDSLDAVGWGLAYPDLFRGIGFPWLVNKYVDRGYAMEQDWEREMQKPIKTLASLQKPIMDGKIPIPVFNATLVENGSRFLISPMKFVKEEISEITSDKPQSNPQVLDFHTLYKDQDIKFSVAARLSATFPYISPLARNDSNNTVKEKSYNYHIADGGYFDNAGLFTIVEWLNNWLDEFPKEELNVKRVLLIQINAFPESKLKSQNGYPGWFTEFLGPLKTLYTVRNSTQIARNQEDAELLQEVWKNKKEGKQVDIQPFTIFFPDNREYKQPLSWKLTKKQKDNLESAWKEIVEDENSTFHEIKKTWEETWKIPPSWESES